MSSARNGLATASLWLAAAGAAAAFGIAPPILHHGKQQRRLAALKPLYAIRCENKLYQLEELEDKETSTTELFLKTDRTVEIRETDGPPFRSASGYWEVQPDTNDFTMVINKEFVTGKGGSDMGEFAFQVSRSYSGEMTMVGESVGITGVMRAVEDNDTILGSEAPEVGFFNMIDGTEERVHYAEAAEKLVERMQRMAEERTGKVPRHPDASVPGQPYQAPPMDPNEVFDSLPLAMQEAFQARDVERLNDALLRMRPEEAEWHMERCIASGLWVA